MRWCCCSYVFYAREQPWTPITIIGHHRRQDPRSLLAPHITVIPNWSRAYLRLWLTDSDFSPARSSATTYYVGLRPDGANDRRRRGANRPGDRPYASLLAAAGTWPSVTRAKRADGHAGYRFYHCRCWLSHHAANSGCGHPLRTGAKRRGRRWMPMQANQEPAADRASAQNM